jgi:hypothetical protein
MPSALFVEFEFLRTFVYCRFVPGIGIVRRERRGRYRFRMFRKNRYRHFDGGVLLRERRLRNRLFVGNGHENQLYLFDGNERARVGDRRRRERRGKLLGRCPDLRLCEQTRYRNCMEHGLLVPADLERLGMGPSGFRDRSRRDSGHDRVPLQVRYRLWLGFRDFGVPRLRERNLRNGERSEPLEQFDDYRARSMFTMNAKRKRSHHRNRMDLDLRGTV